jgi:hypothetical protein
MLDCAENRCRGIPLPANVIVWTDGCANQFRSRNSVFFDEAWRAGIFDYGLMHNYHEACHGKDKYNSAGGELKRAASEFNKHSPEMAIRTSGQLVGWACEHHAVRKPTTFLSRAGSVKLS